MKQIAVIHLGDANSEEVVSLLDQKVRVLQFGCGGDGEKARTLIAEQDGKVDCIALDGLPATLYLGNSQRPHAVGATLPAAATETPVVDGSGIRGGLERWAVILADRAQPGIFAEKRVLLTPGLNHSGLAQALVRHTKQMRYADPIVYFGLPDFPLVGAHRTLEQVAGPTLEQLKDAPFRRLHPAPGAPQHERSSDPFLWADVIAGDIGAILRYGPDTMARKTVVVECATPAELDALKQRGVSIVVTLMPSLDPQSTLGRWPAAVVEAVLVALRRDPQMPLNEDTYLDLMADLVWTPAISSYLQPEDAGINRFAFVIHPLSVRFIHNHPLFRWTKYLPDDLVEAVAAYMPPIPSRASPAASRPPPASASRGISSAWGPRRAR
jgi:hypothetical protein